MTRSSYGIAKQHFFMDACMSEVLEEDTSEKVVAGTKVMITIGPACQDVETLSQLLLAGVNCARIDLTWGTPKFHRTSLVNLSQAMRATKRLCAVVLDTTGREIMVHRPMNIDDYGWMSQKEAISFKAGSEVTITSDLTVKASSSILPVNAPKFCQLVEPGQVLHVGRFLNTGAEGASLFLQVKESSVKELKCVAVNNATLDGLLTVVVSHRTFRLQVHDHDLNAELPLLTPNDTACLKEFSTDFEVDFISLSYCNSAEDVASARESLDQLGLTQTKILAKVERKAAIHNFNAIVEAADGVIFSRGNLGIDFEPEEMAQLQKLCINRCNSLGKSIIITRCVDTMVNTPRPTRAEATDVANAILDGADGILLGAETLRGLYPVITVDTIVRLCASAEKYFDYRNHHETLMGESETWEEEGALEQKFGSTMNLADSPADGGGAGGYAWNLAGKRAISFRDIPSAAAAAQKHHGNGLGAAAAASPPAPLQRTQGETGSGIIRPSSFGNLPRIPSGQIDRPSDQIMSKLESIASSAARVAEKINAGLIVVLAQTGRTVSLVAKYRPPMPILSVVVPTLKSSKLGWKLEGKYLARQCLIMRGVHPLMAAPMVGGGEALLEEAITIAHSKHLVKPDQYAVCIMSSRGSLMLKVVQVNAEGSGIRSAMLGNPMQPLLDLVAIETNSGSIETEMPQVGGALGDLDSQPLGSGSAAGLESPYTGISKAKEAAARSPNSGGKKSSMNLPGAGLFGKKNKQ